MLKAVQNCIDSQTDRKFGNHATFWSYVSTGDIVQYFTYHDNIICRVNWTRKTVQLTNAGWNTKSTNRALNDYKAYFSDSSNFAPGVEFEITDTRENN